LNLTVQYTLVCLGPRHFKRGKGVQTKAMLRQKALAKRRSLSETQCHEYSKQITRRLMKLDVFQQSQVIAIYFATPDEVQTDEIIKAIHAPQKHACLPVIDPDNPGNMQFHTYDATNRLKPNRHKILEPIGTECVPLDQIDLILLPLVAFDQAKQRIGMGLGFYDRILGDQSIKARSCGLAFDCQEVACIPADRWDQALDMILTPSRVISDLN
jgi:5-formyltetrahydrofolate cyclo-ligase